MRAGLDASISTVAASRNIVPRTIAHVGAHLGQELDSYRSLKPNRILYFEPIPDVCASLREKAASAREVSIFNVAISDANGTATFRVYAGSKQSSSLFVRRRAAIDQTDLEREIEVPTRTLDTILAEHGLSSDVNVLVSDTQGAELLVLRGATTTLKTVDILEIELSYLNVYIDGANGNAVQELVSQKGFEIIAVDPVVWHPAIVFEDTCVLMRDLFSRDPATLPEMYRGARRALEQSANFLRYAKQRRESEWSGTAACAADAAVRDEFDHYLAFLSERGMQHTNLETNAICVPVRAR